MRTAKDGSKEKLFTKLKSWYMEKEDGASKAAVAYTFQVISVIHITWHTYVHRTYNQKAPPPPTFLVAR